MDPHAIVQSQLDLAYKVYNESYEQRLNDKKLCVTLWLAVIGFVSARSRVPTQAVILFTFSPIVMFWLLDGARAVYTRLWGTRILRLEMLLVRDHIEIPDIQPLLFVSGTSYTFRAKIKSLLVALFTMESVFAFYLFLVLVNSAFLFIYSHAK